MAPVSSKATDALVDGTNGSESVTGTGASTYTPMFREYVACQCRGAEQCART